MCVPDAATSFNPKEDIEGICAYFVRSKTGNIIIIIDRLIGTQC